LAGRTLRISQVGLRGVVGAGVTAEHVLDFASAFAAFLEVPGPVVIGRDPRASGRMLREGVCAALLASGRDVIDLGIASTPVIQHAIRRFDAAGGVSIGASHSPAEWNALKFLGPKGTYLSTGEANELLDIYHLRQFDFVAWDRLGRLLEDSSALDAYLDSLTGVYELERIRNLRIVIDCSNGTSGPILRRMNARYGLDWILINADADGVFAHEPSTSARAVQYQLGPLIPPLHADAGFLFDADSDRVAIATAQGVAVGEELVLALATDHVLSRSPGKALLTNLSTTMLLDEIATARGGRVIRVPVGRNAFTDALNVYSADEIGLAGEGTGAVMFPQFRFVYDGIATMLTLLEMRVERDRPFHDLLAGYPVYQMRKGEVPLNRRRIPRMFDALEEHFPGGETNTQDGLRIDFPGRWFHVRVSQTEPLVRIIAECKEQSPEEMFQAVCDIVRAHA
jgi:phosphomannomutase